MTRTVAPTPVSVIVFWTAVANNVGVRALEADDAAATSEAATEATKATVVLRRREAEEETVEPCLMELVVLSHRPMDLANAAS